MEDEERGRKTEKKREVKRDIGTWEQIKEIDKMRRRRQKQRERERERDREEGKDSDLHHYIKQLSV